MAVVSFFASQFSLQAQWHIANPSPGQTFTRLVVGGDGQVASGVVLAPGLMASPSGTSDWRSQHLPRFIDGTSTVGDLFWANGKWVAASPGYIHSSTDLVNWTASALLPMIPSVVNWDGAKYWAFGYAGRVASSSDAVTWTQLPNNNLAIPQPADSVWFNNRFIVTGQNTIASSPDGATWTTHVSASPYYVGDIHAGGGRLIAVGSNLAGTTTNFFRSVDGTTWTTIPAPTTAGGYQSITYGNGRWLALNYFGAIYSSTDNGDSWQNVGGIGGGPSSFTRTLGYRESDKRFFCGRLNGKIFSSTDNGTTWVDHQQGFDGSVTMIAEGGGRVVGVGNAGGGPGSIYTSVDGSRWLSNNTGFADNFVSLRYLNGAFLGYSLSPKSVIRSTDGVNFTRSVQGPGIRDILWDGKRYVGFANTGTNLYSSADGVDWTAIPGVGHPASFKVTFGIGSFAFIDGRYMIFSQGFGGETRFSSSTDLVTWNSSVISGASGINNNNYSDIIKSGNKYYVSAQQSLFSSTDGINWTGNNYSSLPAETPQPAGTSLIDRSGRLYTMQYLGANTYSGQRLIYSDDGATWNLETNSFPAPFLPNSKNLLLYTGTRLLAANFAGGLFAYYDIDLLPGGGNSGGQSLASWITSQGVPADQQGPLDDPDGDGFNNGSEFALGTSPNSAAPGQKPELVSGTVIDGAESYPSISFIRRRNATGVNISVEGATDVSFSPTNPTTTLTPVDLGNGTERVTVRGNSPASPTAAFFFRVKITAP